jgi:hypothetical protein
MHLQFLRRPRPSGNPGPRAARRPLRAGRTAGSLGSLVAACLLAGCNGLPTRLPSETARQGGFFGWHVQAPFDTSEIKTVFIYFKTNSFRRDVQQMLTEAIQKEIELRTPYKVVGDPSKADSLLSGTIMFSDKNLIVEAPTNLPRQLNASINIWVNWTHNPPTEVEKARLPTLISQTDYFVPEIGETTLTAFERVTYDLSKQIVDMMEQPWFLEEDLK